MFERLRELVDRDPSLVHARGGDGKTPLHCARTVEIAQYLIDRGADIDARDVDHESTPAQYLVREAPDVARLLVERGAWFDIFIAVGLRDAGARRALSARRPRGARSSHRAGQVHGRAQRQRAATREEIGDRRGDIYRWVFDHNISAVEAAALLGYDDIVELLLRSRVAGAAAARRVRESRSRRRRGRGRRASGCRRAASRADQMRLIADKAHANDTAAVALMLDLGFDPRVRGPRPRRRASLGGLSRQCRDGALLLRHDPPIGVRDSRHGGTPLDWCVYGAVRRVGKDRAGDFAATVRLLLDAGEHVDPSDLPTGRDDVDAVLRAHLWAAAAPA